MSQLISPMISPHPNYSGVRPDLFIVDCGSIDTLQPAIRSMSDFVYVVWDNKEHDMQVAVSSTDELKLKIRSWLSNESSVSAGGRGSKTAEKDNGDEEAIIMCMVTVSSILSMIASDSSDDDVLSRKKICLVDFFTSMPPSSRPFWSNLSALGPGAPLDELCKIIEKGHERFVFIETGEVGSNNFFREVCNRRNLVDRIGLDLLMHFDKIALVKRGCLLVIG